MRKQDDSDDSLGCLIIIALFLIYIGLQELYSDSVAKLVAGGILLLLVIGALLIKFLSPK